MNVNFTELTLRTKKRWKKYNSASSNDDKQRNTLGFEIKLNNV